MTKIQSSLPNEGKNYLFDSARQYVLNLWNEQRDRRLRYHNYAQAASVASLVERIADAAKLSDDVRETALLAAWFHNAGYLYDYQNFAEKSAVSAEFFLAERRYVPEDIHRVHQCIITATTNLQPKPIEAQLLSDAIQAYELVETYSDMLPILRLEHELMGKKSYSESEWDKFVFQRLLDANFYLGYSKTNFEPKVAQNFLALKDKMAKGLQAETLQQPSNAPKTKATPVAASSLAANTKTPKAEEGKSLKLDGNFEGLTGRKMRNAVQTYFRSNYSNHIQLSAIADNKAHIMISVNSIMLSVAISMLTYQTYTDKNPLLILPIVIFMVTGLTSLIFAVLSSRPRVSTQVPETTNKAKSNFIFFGNFVNLNLSDYEEAIDTMLRDGALLYGNMTRDMYYLGKVLDKKYRLLTFSYNVFMLGFVATVVAFLAVYFMR